MKWKMLVSGFLSGLLGLYAFCACQPQEEAFILVDNDQKAGIYLPATASDPIRMAVQDLIKDVEKISGKRMEITDQQDEANLLVFNFDEEDQAQQAVQIYAELDTLKGKWESYVVQKIVHEEGNKLIFAGSDERATMFALYHFIEEYLGVDPLYFWKDYEPGLKEVLSWTEINIQSDAPSFKYRGWFINDEDLLTEWKLSGGKRKIDYPYYGDVVDPEVIERVVEALVRLRMNLIIPASFIDIHNPAEEALVQVAARRGVFISQHHVEPMGVSAFSFFNYWEKKGKEPLFSFYSSRKELEEVWKFYADKWAYYPNVIWQIGLRGIADRPMWMADPNVPQTDEERGRLISEAMQVQMEMIKNVDQREAPPVTTTLWAEGSIFNQKGYLQIPFDVMVIFSDNSPGWKWQQDFYETPREEAKRYGVYYHHQLWGSGPHLAQGIPPQQTHKVMGEAFKHQADAYAIMNVSNIREFTLGLEASSQMLYDFQSFEPDAFLSEWIQKNYPEAPFEVKQAYQQYFDAFVMHPDTQTPMFLDGQMRGQGSKLLRQLELQMTDPKSYLEEEAKARQMTVEKSWGSTHLSDMHPDVNDPQEKLRLIQRQKKGFEETSALVDAALEKMGDNASKALLQTNLLSQLMIMTGLCVWLENIILAKMRYDQGDTDASLSHLEKAHQAFDTIRQGQKINAQGEKWAYWYRGEKKMNLAAMQLHTGKVLQAARQLNAR